MMPADNIELADQGDNIIRTIDIDLNPNSKGLAHELFTNLKKHQGKIAQIDAESGETDTFDDFLQRCVRVALHLKKLGITAEDVVSPCTSNHLNSSVALVAPLLFGAKTACLDPTATFLDIKGMINVVKSKLFFVSEDGVEKVERALEELNLEAEIVVFGATTKHIPFAKLLEPFPKDVEDSFAPYEVENLFETAVIIFSSGSTGEPNGICVNHYALLCQFIRMRRENTSRTAILFSTLVWMTGQMFAVNDICIGNARLICSIFSVDKVWRYAIKYDAKVLCLTPHDTWTFLKHGNPDKLETPALQAVAISGGKVSAENMKLIQKIFLKPVLVLSPYGQTEVYSSIFEFRSLQTLIEKPESVGQAVANNWYKIVDPESGRNCGPNETGEICLKSKYVMNGYYKSDSSDRFDCDGFLRTGDMGYYDEAHCFYIVDRLRESLRYKMVWIPPTLLENILIVHPAVRVAVVIGLPSAEGDVATAVMVKSDSAGAISETELLNYVNERVDDNKRIRGGIIFVEYSFIPYTPSGKIRRFLLKRQILENLDNYNVKIDS